MGLESKVHDALMGLPALKKAVKRIYQGTSVAVSRPKKKEGDIKRITPSDDFEYLFGYYDKSPWDASGRYMLCIRVKDASKEVAPKEGAEIMLIDTENGGKTEVIAKTKTWNVQQGCMLGWLGPKYDKEIIYNDFRNGKFCGVIKNIKNGQEKILERPVYSVSDDGKVALSLDFSRLNRMRPGYGYSNLEDKTNGEKVPEGPCVWKVDLKTGKTEPILTYKELFDFEHRTDMDGAEHKVNHLMLSPNGKRFMVIHRWLKGGKKTSRLLTCNIDGSELYNLSDDNMVSHCYWKNNKEILAYCQKGDKKGYFLMKDQTPDFEQKWEWLTADGHPSYSPDGKLVVTDTYPNRKRIATLRVMSDNVSTILAKVYAPFKYDNDVRCDLHPRWSRDGKKICFDACFEGKRGVYAVKINNQIKQKEPQNSQTEQGLVSCVIPTYKRSDMIKRAIDSILNQTYKNIEVLVVDDNEKNDKHSKELEKTLLNYKNNKRVKLLRQPKHINGAAARNFGIQNASGEYIAFLDDDDEWLNDKIEKQLKLFSSTVGVVTCLWSTFKNNQIIRSCPPYNANNIQFKVLSRTISIYTSTVIIRADVIKEFGGFDESLSRHQDLQFLTDASSKTQFAVLPEYLVKLHTDSDINRPKVRQLIKHKKIFLACEKSTINSYNFINRKRIYGAHWFEIIYAALKEKKIGIAILYGLRVCLNVPAILDVAKRAAGRKEQ